MKTRPEKTVNYYSLFFIHFLVGYCICLSVSRTMTQWWITTQCLALRTEEVSFLHSSGYKCRMRPSYCNGIVYKPETCNSVEYSIFFLVQLHSNYTLLQGSTNCHCIGSTCTLMTFSQTVWILRLFGHHLPMKHMNYETIILKKRDTTIMLFML